jgi:hypothetical protein
MCHLPSTNWRENMVANNNIDYQRIATEAIAALTKIEEIPYGDAVGEEAEPFVKDRTTAERVLQKLNIKYKQVD